MNKFIRYWNQNRRKIIIIVAIIAFFIILIQITNSFLKNSNNDTTQKNQIDKSKPIQSIITGETISEEKTDTNVNLIKEFIDYGNSKQYQQAYELLSDDCKAEFNNDVNIFITNYGNKVFETNKTYKLELWLTASNLYTYQVTYYEDNLLATGGSNINKNIQDYITIEIKGEEEKLNINGFITKKEINKSAKTDDIEIVVNSKKVYKSYEKYNITINNYSDKTILLSEGQNGKDICLLDKNEVNYNSYINEIINSELIVESKSQKDINIKFNKIYNVYREIEKLKFDNIIADYDYYTNNKSAEDIKKVEIEVEI